MTYIPLHVLNKYLLTNLVRSVVESVDGPDFQTNMETLYSYCFCCRETLVEFLSNTQLVTDVLISSSHLCPSEAVIQSMPFKDLDDQDIYARKEYLRWQKVRDPISFPYFHPTHPTPTFPKRHIDKKIRIDMGLIKAAAQGRLDVVRLLCNKYGADVHVGQDWPLSCAIGNGHKHVVVVLLDDYGASIKEEDDFFFSFLCDDEDTCSARAAANGRLDVIKTIRERCAHIWDEGIPISTIHATCRHGHLNVLEYFCDNYPSELITMNHRYNLMEIFRKTCSYGHLHVLRYLREKFPFFIDNDSKIDNALQMAIKGGVHTSWIGYVTVAVLLVLSYALLSYLPLASE